MNPNGEDLLVNSPKTARGQETLQRICRAAEEIFYEKGYHASAINDITHRAGISAGTFYIYFDSKLSIYKYLLTDYGQTIRRHIRTAIAHCTTRREAEREGLRAWLYFVSEHKHVFNIAWESLFIDKKLFDDYYASFSAAYVQQLKKAQADGEVCEIDPEVLSFALMGIANFIGLHWVIFSDAQNFDYVVDEVMKILDGIFPDRELNTSALQVDDGSTPTPK